MSRFPALRWFIGIATLSILAPATADTVETKQDERLKGRVVRETPAHLVMRTAYGELTIPKAQVKKHDRATYIVELKDGSKLEGQIVAEDDKALSLKIGSDTRALAPADVKGVTEKPPTPAAPKPDPQRLLQLHRRALEMFDKKDYKAALAACLEILKTSPDDPTALYNAACALARQGEKPKALDYLKQSVEAGFVDFLHIERDPDLESLRDEAAFKELLAKKDEYTKKASEKTIERITKTLAERGIDAKRYKTLTDPERNFVYLHAKDDKEIAELRRSLEAYADCQWRDLFQNKPQRPLYIVLLTAADTPKVFTGGIGGFYNPASSALFCSDMPVNKLLRADVVLHEFTHALHYADMLARRQEHPIWLIEGLATLFESSDRDGTVKPRQNHRLLVAQQAARQGRLLPWTALMGFTHPQFMAQAQLAYAQARYMLFYMHEKGLLKRFYDEYTADANYARDRAAIDSFQAVFGKPIEEVERDWKQWLVKQSVPPVPFLGVATREQDNKLVIAQVTPGSPADKAGIKANDVLLKIAGRELDSTSDLMEAVAGLQAGDEVEVEVQREEKKLSLKAKLTTRTDLTPRAPEMAPYLGLTVEQRNGAVVIREVAPTSPAGQAGLKPGAEIAEFEGKKPATVRDFLAALRKMKPGQKVKLATKLGDEARTFTIELAPQPLPE
ncbi:MAG TPA: PDZ domain-containing protein [Planctomycetota bacterium]|nr:PDZ domain-containing protein [Planctomycetota bacterium]